MASLTKPAPALPTYETRARGIRMPLNPVAQLEDALEKRTLEVAVLEYFWDR